MKLWKKILIFLGCTILLAQAPFIYNRFRLASISEKAAQLNANRALKGHSDYADYAGVIHVHSSLGGHSTATFDELIGAANSNRLDFVVVTEHYSELFDTSSMTLRGNHGNTLFLNGNEIDTANGDRFLMIDGGPEAAGFRLRQTGEVLSKLKSDGKLAMITYPEKFRSWDSDFDGIEVFSLHTNAKKMNPFTFLLNAAWSFGAYPELLLAQYFQRPDENIARFDEVAAKRKISLFAGSDAHSNIGYHLFGDDTGNKLLYFKFDSYEMVFRLAKTHVLIEKGKPLDRENLLSAIKAGNSYIGFDSLADSSGFFFAAGDKVMGSEVGLDEAVLLRAASPQAARFVVFKNGEKFYESANQDEIAFEAKGPGAYRVEVYLDQLGSPFDKMPWIISNPIFVR